MAISPAVVVSQNILNPVGLTITDTSTGSDPAITQRRVFLQTANGTYLVPTGTTTNYILWPYADASITIDVLNQDYALSILVTWNSVSNAVLYSKTQVCAFTLNSEQFFYGLTQNQTSYPNIVNDTTYYDNKMILRTCIDEADNAVLYASDIYSAQAALDRAAYMIANQNYYF